LKRNTLWPLWPRQPGRSHHNHPTAIGKDGGPRRAAGRPKGVPNKVTTTFRDALLQAVSEIGDSREEGVDGKGGLVGYLKKAAVREEKTTLLLLGRIPRAARLAACDLLGRLKKRWPEMRMLEYQAIAEKDEGWRKKGEALFPEHKPLDFLLERKKLMSEASWNAEYQQRPMLVGMGAISIEKLKVIPFFQSRRYRGDGDVSRQGWHRRR
jgi:hypothetical protein